MNNIFTSILRYALCLLAVAVLSPVVTAQEPDRHLPVKTRHTATDTIPEAPAEVEVTLGETGLAGDSVMATLADSLAVSPYDRWEPREIEFNPDPTRAVWLSALFPGLGQVYNRRYWKLPIIVGGYMGLVYATSWNNNMLNDYTRAYRDLMDNDPSTKSYMDFFPPNTLESDLDRSWLTSVMQSRKNYYRRNRDLCIISMVGVYLLAMVDAYVDASLSHFDLTPELSMDVSPVVFQEARGEKPAFGMTWALTF